MIASSGAAKAIAADAAAAPAGRWPRAEEWAVLKEHLSQEQLAHVQELQSHSDSLFLAKVSAILDPRRLNDNVTIYQLVATHSATLIYIILVRVSPDEWMIFEVQTCESQKSRCFAAYEYLEKDAEKGSVLLYPVSVAARGISRWDETGKKDEVIEKLKSIIDTIKSNIPGKKICVLVTEPNRLDGDPEKAFEIVDDIEGRGDVEVEFLKFFKGPRDVLKEATVIHEGEKQEISKIATHVDAAKSLREELGGEVKEEQKRINDASVQIQEKLSCEGSEPRKWLDKGVAEGKKFLEAYTMFADKKTIEGQFLHLTLEELRMMPDKDNEVPEEARKAATRFLRNAREDLSEAEIGPPDLTVTYLRGSPEKKTNRVDITIEGKKVPAQQAALAYTSYKDLGLLDDGTTHVILPLIAKRQAAYVEAYGCLAELYAKGRIKTLGFKAPPRLSQHRGYVDFWDALNEKTGAKPFCMTACRGLEPGPIALNEQRRALRLRASTDKYRKALVLSDEVSNFLSELAWSHQFADEAKVLERWEFEDEDHKDEDA